MAEILEAAGDEPPELEPMRLPLDRDLLALAETVSSEISAPGAASRLFVDQLRLAAIVRLSRLAATRAGASTRQSNGTAPTVQLDRAIACIRDRLAENLSIGTLADAADMSPFHFSRVFRNYTGLSPYRFLTEQRIKRPKELLAGTRMSVTEIAHICGFSSSQHLAKAFRRHVGRSPGDYKRHVRSGS
jgi:AraC family transcriptional regulator